MEKLWKRLAELAGKNERPFTKPSLEFIEGIEHSEMVIEFIKTLYPPDYLDLYGYRLFPPENEILTWSEKVEGWKDEWFPLSSNYHQFVFFFDLESKEVRRVFLDNPKDEDGFLLNDQRVYPDFENFLKAILLNYKWIQKSSFSISVEGFFKEEVATLLPSVARKIKEEGRDIKGPILLPFFEGTLGEYNSLADI